MAKTKKCPSCGKRKAVSQFNKRTSSKDGLQSSCRQCNSLQFKEWSKDTDKKRKRWLKSKYGISTDDYHKMFKSQKEKCKICGIKTTEFLHVDHCHTTGKVRGLLCPMCNKGLGLFKDDKRSLRRAIKYLEGK